MKLKRDSNPQNLLQGEALTKEVYNRTVCEANFRRAKRAESLAARQKKSNCVLQLLFQLYSPCGELYCYAVIFGFQPSDIALRQLKRANIISLRQRRNITFAKAKISCRVKYRFSSVLLFLCENEIKKGFEPPKSFARRSLGKRRSIIGQFAKQTLGERSEPSPLQRATKDLDI